MHASLFLPPPNSVPARVRTGGAGFSLLVRGPGSRFSSGGSGLPFSNTIRERRPPVTALDPKSGAPRWCVSWRRRSVSSAGRLSEAMAALGCYSGERHTQISPLWSKRAESQPPTSPACHAASRYNSAAWKRGPTHVIHVADAADVRFPMRLSSKMRMDVERVG